MRSYDSRPPTLDLILNVPSATLVALSLGSNLGDRIGTLRHALEAIGSLEGVEMVAISSFYRTEPVGVQEQPEFINCAAVIETTLAPEALLRRLRSIETDLGRQARRKWHEREIDIDILLYGGETITSEDLVIPHPGMRMRGFVLHPLAEIAPRMVDPVQGLSVEQMLAVCSDGAAVVKVEAGSE